MHLTVPTATYIPFQRGHVAAAQDAFERRCAEAEAFREQQAEDHARAVCSFDAALASGSVDTPVYSPVRDKPLRTEALHSIVWDELDARDVVELLVAAHQGVAVRVRAELILSVVRERHADWVADTAGV